MMIIFQTKFYKKFVTVPCETFEETIEAVDKKEAEVSKQVIAKDATYFTNQDRLRTLIAAHTPIFPPRVTNKDYQIIMENLYETQNVESPPPGTSDKELLQKHLEEYNAMRNDVAALALSLGTPLTLFILEFL